MLETRLGCEVRTRSSMLAAEAVVLVGSVTSCSRENTEHISKNSLASVEGGCIVGTVLDQVMFGILKSPSKSNGQFGQRDETMLITSCNSCTKFCV